VHPKAVSKILIDKFQLFLISAVMAAIINNEVAVNKAGVIRTSNYPM